MTYFDDANTSLGSLSESVRTSLTTPMVYTTNNASSSVERLPTKSDVYPELVCSTRRQSKRALPTKQCLLGIPRGGYLAMGCRVSLHPWLGQSYRRTTAALDRHICLKEQQAMESMSINILKAKKLLLEQEMDQLEQEAHHFKSCGLKCAAMASYQSLL